MKSLRFLPLAALLAGLLAGCGASDLGSSSAPASSADMVGAATESDEARAPAKSGAGSAVGASAQTVAQAQRKIIYTATVDLIVEDLTAGQSKLTQLVKSSGGYIAETNVGGASGEQREGSWKVRVPVEKYEAFMQGAQRLGELQSINSKSQDVTAEFYDVAARIKNKQVEEKRLQELLRRATGKLTEVLQVEKELSRVRGEIEQLQGRIRVLTNLSSLTTVTLTIREIKDYVAPAPPTFGTEIARQFDGSLKVMKAAGKGLVLFGAALAPWLPFALIGFFVWRFFRGKNKN